MANSTENKVIVLEPCTKVVEDLLKAMAEKNQAEIIRVTSAEEAVQLVRQFQPCMLTACIQENSELPARVSLLKNLESSIKYGLVKTFFVSKVKNKQIGALISSLGVTDFMEEPVPLRTLQFKANLQLKAVETIRKQQEQKKASQEKVVFKKMGEKAEGETPADPQAKASPALELDEDTFLFKNSGVKKQGKKFVVELEGPDPESGEWIQHEDQGNAKTAWRWVPEEEKETPEVARGDGWMHEGDKPQFQETNNKWQFASETPELAYAKAGKKVAKKVSVSPNGEIVVANDSQKASANVQKTKVAGERVKSKREEKARRKEAVEKAKQAALARTSESPEIAGETAQTKITGSETVVESAAAKTTHDLSPDEAAPFNGEVGADSAPVVELNDRRSAAEEKKKGKKGALSPLDFLKKKKELLESSAPLESRAEAQNEERSALALEAGEEEVAAKKRAEKITEPAEIAKKPKKSSAAAAREMLDRMKNKLGEEVPEARSDTTESGNQTEEEESSVPASLVLGKEEKPEKSSEEFSSLRAEEKEKSRGKKDGPPQVHSKTKKERKKEVLSEIQAMLAHPLLKEMPAEEEQKLRKELGLEDAPHITVEELARKARVAKVKALRDGLLDLESSFQEETPEHKQHDLRPDEIENNWSEGSGGVAGSAGGKRRAFDSDLAEEEEAEREPGLASGKKEKKVRAEKEDPYSYLPEAELTPLGGAWERSGEYQTFLAAEVKYHGFKKLEDLLPLWSYAGEGSPELLDKTKKWRFHGPLPRLAQTLAEIPREVRDYLLELRERLKVEVKDRGEQESANKKEEVFEASTAEIPKKKDKGPDLAALYASFEKDAKALRKESAEEKEAENQAATLEELFDSKPEPVRELDRVKGESAGIDAFLERRKNKPKAAAPTPRARSESTNPYLGIFVALSNSFGLARDRLRATGKVLKSMEASFGTCACALLGAVSEDGQAEVRIGSDDHFEPGAKMNPAAVGGMPIRNSLEGEILGYLVVKSIGTRETFTDREMETINQVVAYLWPVLAGEPMPEQNPEEKKAA